MALKNPIVFNTTFDTYTATEIIGEGGSARVFKAVDDSGHTCAIKLLEPSKATKEKVNDSRTSVCSASIISTLTS